MCARLKMWTYLHCTLVEQVLTKIINLHINHTLRNNQLFVGHFPPNFPELSVSNVS